MWSLRLAHGRNDLNASFVRYDATEGGVAHTRCWYVCSSPHLVLFCRLALWINVSQKSADYDNRAQYVNLFCCSRRIRWPELIVPRRRSLTLSRGSLGSWHRVVAVVLVVCMCHVHDRCLLVSCMRSRFSPLGHLWFPYPFGSSVFFAICCTGQRCAIVRDKGLLTDLFGSGAVTILGLIL